MGNTNGSLVDARQNPILYTIILVVLAVVLVLALVGLVLRQIRARRATSNWLDSKKDAPTSQKNINNVADLAKLTQDERKMLKLICQHFKPKNIEYLIRDEHAIVELCRQEYMEMIKKNPVPEKLEMLFTLMYKMEKARDSQLFISTTRALPAGQEFTYFDTDRNSWTLKLDRNEPQELVLDVPRAFAQGDKKPAALSKFLMTFKSSVGTTYVLQTRALRYEEEKPGKFVLIASSTGGNQLSVVQRRSAKRLSTDGPCTFSAVKEVKKGKKSGTLDEFEVLPKKYDGRLQNISSTGCRFSCSLPIKEGQYLYLEFPVGDSHSGSALCYIVMTKKSPDGKQFILHVKFTDIEIAVKNAISAFVYGFDKIS
ncbi:MAG TPA: hypothetical protein DDW78_02170 [Treponema sp.]|nr:hypothetical protein [Treponema sp.]